MMANMTQARAARASIKTLLGLVASKRRQGFQPVDLLDVIKMQLTSTERDVVRWGRENARWFLVPIDAWACKPKAEPDGYYVD